MNIMGSSSLQAQAQALALAQALAQAQQPQSLSTSPALSFIHKLYNIFHDKRFVSKSKTSGICYWSENGTKINIPDINKFLLNIKEYSFNHNNLQSFKRQLRNYSFTLEYKRNSYSTESSGTWHHPFFVQNRYDLLKSIHLIKQKKRQKQGVSTTLTSLLALSKPLKKKRKIQHSSKLKAKDSLLLQHQLLLQQQQLKQQQLQHAVDDDDDDEMNECDDELEICEVGAEVEADVEDLLSLRRLPFASSTDQHKRIDYSQIQQLPYVVDIDVPMPDSNADMQSKIKLFYNYLLIESLHASNDVIKTIFKDILFTFESSFINYNNNESLVNTFSSSFNNFSLSANTIELLLEMKR